VRYLKHFASGQTYEFNSHAIGAEEFISPAFSMDLRSVHIDLTWAAGSPILRLDWGPKWHRRSVRHCSCD
jgi:hypothetical protein